MTQPVNTLSPAERAKLAKQKDAERAAANQYRFPKGNGPDPDNKGHHGKIITCMDTTTKLKGTPLWEIKVLTQEKKPDGSKVELKFNFWKSDKSLDFLYKMLEQAGADLSSIPARAIDQSTHDDMVNKCLDVLENNNAKIRFSCSHTERKGDPKNPNINLQKDGTNVNFYIREFLTIDGKLPLVGVLSPATSTGKKAESVASSIPPDTDEGLKDSAFNDDDE